MRFLNAPIFVFAALCFLSHSALAIIGDPINSIHPFRQRQPQGAQPQPTKISAGLRRELAQSPAKETTVIIHMRAGTAAILNDPDLQRQFHPTREAHISAMANALEAHAQKTQKRVCDHMDAIKEAKTKRKGHHFHSKSNFDYTPIWISNKIIVRGVDMPTIEALAAVHNEDIEEIREDAVIMLDSRSRSRPVNMTAINSQYYNQRVDALLGARQIRADLVWQLNGNQGEGVRVANIDTGVNVNHVALKDNYADDGFSWFDPFNGSPTPYDDNGHGTHVMGSFVGKFGIGVAPGAVWMACKGCDSGSGCPDSMLTMCLQYILCPTNPNSSPNGYNGSSLSSINNINGYPYTDTSPAHKGRDCSYAPHVLSCSWGGPSTSDDPFYSELYAIYKANIISVFSIGNSGPECGTAGDPGSYSIVIGVGAVDRGRNLAFFSSCGNSTRGYNEMPKPDVTAPGVRVLSANYANDDTYVTMSGTSMACPHVAGVVALMRSRNRHLSFEKIRNILYGSTKRQALTQTKITGVIMGDAGDISYTVTTTNNTCACGTPYHSYKRYPNNCEGWGEVDALTSVNNTPKLKYYY